MNDADWLNVVLYALGLATGLWSGWAAWRRSALKRDDRTRSQKLADAGFARRPTLLAMEMRTALEIIAAPRRPDGTWNRDREACRQIAAEALGRYEDKEAPNEKAQAGPR